MRAMSRAKKGEASTTVSGPLFLSRGQVALLFGVSASTVTRWARLGLLPAFRTPGGHYRFPAEETRRAAGRAATSDFVRLD
jgi:excisionase family DNA binding protein